MSALRVVVAATLLVSMCLLVSANVPHAVRSADGSFAVLFGAAEGQGSIKVFQNTSVNARGDAHYQRTFEMRFARIEETDSVTGNKVQSALGFAADATMWEGPDAVTVDGVTAQLVTLTNDALMINGRASSASLTISAYLYSVSGFVRQANESLSVPKNALKLTFGISSWPFVSMSNNLTFGLELMLDTRSSQNQHDPDRSDMDHGRQRRMAWGGAALDVAANAVVDGTLVPIASTLSQNGARTFIAFNFPSFNQSVMYDPTVSIDGTTTSAAASTMQGASFALFALLAAAVASMQL